MPPSQILRRISLALVLFLHSTRLSVPADVVIPYVDWAPDFDQPASVPLDGMPAFRSGFGEPASFVFMPSIVDFRSRGAGQPNYRVLWNSIHTTGSLDFAAGQAVVVTRLYVDSSRLQRTVKFIGAQFPGARFGIAIPKNVKLSILVSPLFGSSKSSIPLNESRNSWMSFVTLTPLAIKAMAASHFDGDMLGARYEFDVDGKEADLSVRRAFSAGATVDLSCAKHPEAFFDELRLEQGCPELSRLDSMSSQVRECIMSMTNDLSLADQIAEFDCLMKIGRKFR